MNMEYLQKINLKFEKGLSDGRRETYRPGLIYGKIRMAYDSGYEQGLRIKRVIQKNRGEPHDLGTLLQNRRSKRCFFSR